MAIDRIYHIYHDSSWHIMTFCHKNKKFHFVTKACNYGIFVQKIYDYALFDSFWGSAGFIDSPTIYATLDVPYIIFTASSVLYFSLNLWNFLCSELSFLEELPLRCNGGHFWQYFSDVLIKVVLYQRLPSLIIIATILPFCKVWNMEWVDGEGEGI